MSLARVHIAVALTAALATVILAATPGRAAAQAPLERSTQTEAQTTPQTEAQTAAQTAARTAAQPASQTAAQTGSQTSAQPGGSVRSTMPRLIPGGGLTLIPMQQPAISPAVAHLIELETRFSDATSAGGGKAFASFFAEDGVVLGNGLAPVIGEAAIAASARWQPAEYTLSWVPSAAQMSAAGDMGFTWGRYTGISHDVNGKTVTTSGRYMTIWKIMPDKSWKVVLESSAQEPAAALSSVLSSATPMPSERTASTSAAPGPASAAAAQVLSRSVGGGFQGGH